MKLKYVSLLLACSLVLGSVSPSVYAESLTDENVIEVTYEDNGENRIDDISNNMAGSEDANNSIMGSENNTGDISFGEFCDIFKNIYESSLENSNKIFLEGFCFMDKDK